MTEEKVQIKITAENSDATRGINQTKQGISDLDGPINNASNNFRKLGGALAAAFAAERIMSFSKHIVDLAGNFQDMSNKTGMSIESLQRFKQVGEQSGSSMEALANGMQRFNVRLESGNKSTISALQQLGVSVQALKAQAPEQQFLTIATAISNIENPAQRSAAAMALLGRQGLEMMKIFAEGPEKIAATMNAARVNTEAEIAALDELGDKLTESKLNIESWGITFLNVVLEMGKGLGMVAYKATIMGNSIQQGLMRASIAALDFAGLPTKAVRDELDRLIMKAADMKLAFEQVNEATLVDGGGKKKGGSASVAGAGTGYFNADTSSEKEKKDKKSPVPQFLKDEVKALDILGKKYDGFFNSIQSASNGMVNGILQGTQTWGQAMTNLWSNLATSFINDFVVKGTLEFIKNQLIQTEMTATQTAARTGIKQAGAAQEGLTNVKLVGSDASVSASGAYKALAGIPVIGPIIAPIGAAAAYAGTMAFASMASFEVGAWEIPQDMPAQLHKGETVVPANFAEGLRQHGGIEGAGNNGGMVNINIHAIDTRSGSQFLMENAHTLSKILKNQSRNFNSNVRMA